VYYPSLKEFIQKSKRGNLIPVYKEILADFETPVSAFTRIDTGDYGYLLESAEKGEELGRYSFLGSNPSLIFKSKGRRVEIITDGKKRIQRVSDFPGLWGDWWVTSLMIWCASLKKSQMRIRMT